MLRRTKPKLTTLGARVQPRSRSCPNRSVKTMEKSHWHGLRPQWGKGETGRFGEFFSSAPSTPSPRREPQQHRVVCAPSAGPAAPRTGRGQTDRQTDWQIDPPRGPAPGAPGNSSRERGASPAQPPRLLCWSGESDSPRGGGGGGWEPWGGTPCIPRIQAF